MMGSKPPQNHCDQIETDLLLTRLHDIAMGKVESNATQIAAIKALLAKVIPDIRSGDQDGSDKDGLPERIEISYVRSQSPSSGQA